jgi:hypothetical protein
MSLENNREPCKPVRRTEVTESKDRQFKRRPNGPIRTVTRTKKRTRTR